MTSTPLPIPAGRLREALAALGFEYSDDDYPTRAVLAGTLACVAEREMHIHTKDPDEAKEVTQGWMEAVAAFTANPAASPESNADAGIDLMAVLAAQRVLMGGSDVGVLMALKDGTDEFGVEPLARALTQALLRLFLLVPTHTPGVSFGPQHASVEFEKMAEDLRRARRLLAESRERARKRP